MENGESSSPNEYSEIFCLPATLPSFQYLDASVNTAEMSPDDSSVSKHKLSSSLNSNFHEQHTHNTECASHDEREIKLYHRRWYILTLFGLFAFTQGGIWNTWSPISTTSKCVFGWTDATLSLLANWGAIAYLVAAVFSAWILDTKGLRPACLLFSFLITVGAGLRCITTSSVVATWLIHIGQFLNGLAGPVAWGSPPLVSALWFPPYQRTTSTAIMAVANGLGIAASFLIGPFMVTEEFSPNTTFSNVTPTYSLPGKDFLRDYTSDSSSICNGTDTTKEAKYILRLMYAECAFSAAVFILMVLYFPNQPPTPPSISATKSRVAFKSGLLNLLTNEKFWLVGSTYAVSLGVFGYWEGVLNVILEPRGISQDEAAWIGFYSVIGSSVGSLVLARFADIFSRHVKLLLLILYTVSVGVLVWFTLVSEGILPNSKVSLYISVLTAGFTLDAACPLFYEISCEMTYPVAEGVTNLVLTSLNNIAGLIFLLILMIPNIGTEWTNWCLIGCVASCLPLISTLKESYHRLDIDENVTENTVNLNS